MSRSIEQMIEEKVLRWEQERRSASTPPPSSVRNIAPAQRPILTISRECGSRGGALGRLVASQLGFEFFSQELVHKIATAARVEASTVGSLDERARGGLEVMLREMIDGKAFAADDYLLHLKRVIEDTGRQGRSVIIGRGGHLLLDPALTMRVRTYATLEARAANVAESQQTSREEALSTVRSVDRERAAFYRKYFNVDWSDPALFDLSINTSAMPLERCADIVAAAFRSRFTSDAP